MDSVEQLPPTTNWLTFRERAQLRRKAKKLGQILGSVPHVVDDSNISTDYICDIPSPTTSLSSPSIASSTGSSLVSSLSRTTSLSYERPVSRSALRFRRALSGDSWPNSMPLIQISKPSPLHSILGSPAYLDTHYVSLTPSLCSTSSASSDDESSPVSQTFSSNTVRVQKMDKLRRTLGDGVPVNLVFPARRKSHSTPSSPAFSSAKERRVTQKPEKMDKLRRTLGDGVPAHLFESTFHDTSCPSSPVSLSPPPSPAPSSIAPSFLDEVTIISTAEKYQIKSDIAPEFLSQPSTRKGLTPLPTASVTPRDSLLLPHKARRAVRRKPVPLLMPSRAAPAPPSPSPSPMTIEQLEKVIDEDIQKFISILHDEAKSAKDIQSRWSAIISESMEKLPKLSS